MSTMLTNVPGFGLSRLKEERTVSFYINDGSDTYVTMSTEEYIKKYGPIPESKSAWLERKVPLAHFDKIYELITKYIEENCEKDWYD